MAEKMTVPFLDQVQDLNVIRPIILNIVITKPPSPVPSLSSPSESSFSSSFILSSVVLGSGQSTNSNFDPGPGVIDHPHIITFIPTPPSSSRMRRLVEKYAVDEGMGRMK